MGEEKVASTAGPMGIQPVPQHQPRRMEFVVERPEEGRDLDGGDIAGMEAKVETEFVAVRADTQGRDGRHLAVVRAPLVQDGGLASRGPTAPHQRCH